jgi:hypothetical protein
MEEDGRRKIHFESDLQSLRGNLMFFAQEDVWKPSIFRTLRLQPQSEPILLLGSFCIQKDASPLAVLAIIPRQM